MGCVKCEDGVWICTDGSADCSDGPALLVTDRWTCKKCVTVQQTTQYYVQCQAGCQDVQLVTTPGARPPWVQVGIVVLDPGTYALYCQPGNGGPCDVAIEELGEGEDCPC